MYRSWLTNIPQQLRRITTSGRYIGEVDGLRFMAIMPVLVQHLSERMIRYSSVDWSTPVADDPVVFLASRGTVGVFIFFAISGFILGLPFAKQHLQGGRKVSLGAYFWRRVTRLEPPYIVWMTVFFLVLLVQSGQAFSELFPHWGASLLYLHNIVYEDYSVINPVAWSLEIEIQFYLLAPFLAALFFRWSNKLFRRGLLLVSILGLLLAQQLFGWAAMPYKLTLLWQLHYFLIGFLLADWYLIDWSHRQATSQGSILLDVLAVAAIFVMCYSWSADLGKRIIFSGALLIFLYAGFRGRWFTRFLRLPWIASIGGMCYTIYLIHLPLLEGLTRLTASWQFTTSFSVNLVVQMLILFPIVIVISAIGFLLLEKPCMDKDWPRKLWQFLRPDDPAVPHIKKVKE